AVDRDPETRIGGNLLSHIVATKTEVRDTAAVAAACRRLALPELVQGTATLFSGQASGLIVKKPCLLACGSGRGWAGGSQCRAAPAARAPWSATGFRGMRRMTAGAPPR